MNLWKPYVAKPYVPNHQRATPYVRVEKKENTDELFLQCTV